MNNYKQILLIGLLGFSCSAFAQRNCGTENTYLFKQRFPAKYDSIENRVSQFLRLKKMEPARVLAVRTIPVVVHVLYNVNTADPTNISDAKIYSQIDRLNLDYRKQNTDWTNTPAVFQSLVADCEVRFCLASTDQVGGPTSGIVRKYTDSVNFSLNGSPKHNNTGGSNAWPTDKYFNIWVAPQIQHGTNNLLGYATFPWQNMGAEDGVVIRYNAFGSLEPVQNQYNLGRTATHEVGHWLGLKHIWGDEAACAADDDVDDTPLQADRNYGCTGFPLRDACTGGNGVMFFNYMDYVDDGCMYMFTAGQKARMDYFLSTDRKQVADNASVGCSNCQYNLTIGGTLSNTINYRSSNEIISTQSILGSAKTDYKTGNKVTLSPGFHAAAGSAVHITTGEICYPPN